MKIYQHVNTWIINIFLMFTGIGLVAVYVVGIVLAFIAIAK